MKKEQDNAICAVTQVGKKGQAAAQVIASQAGLMLSLVNASLLSQASVSQARTTALTLLAKLQHCQVHQNLRLNRS